LTKPVEIHRRTRSCKGQPSTRRRAAGTVEPNHSSGKKLYEVADIAIDNCGPVGDAILQVDGLDTGACPRWLEPGRFSRFILSSRQ